MADEEKKEAEKTEKPQRTGLPLLWMIGIGAGAVIILVVIIVFVMNMMLNNIIDARLENVGIVDSTKTEEKEKKPEPEKEYMETGRITTNPLSSTQFVVVNLGLFYSKDIKEGEPEEETPSETRMQRLSAMIKHKINTQIGSMDITQLQSSRDSLTAVFKEKLESAFKDEKFALKDVILVEFIIQ